jgi:hypothetical protein
MLWRATELNGYEIEASDGSIGSVSDLLFDDSDWSVRWVVIDTGNWLPGRQVLLPPSVVARPDAQTRVLPVDLTREKVKNSPGIDTDKPVSRQMESDVYGYYGWAPYWHPTYVPPIGPVAGGAIGLGHNVMPGEDPREPDVPEGDPHLRSVSEVTGYYVHATDDDIGHVEEFLIEDSTWAIRYLVVDTRNWWPGKQVLVSPDWTRDISWNDRKVYVDLTRDQIKNGPEYDPTIAVNRAYEERLHGHYGYAPYWI